MTNTCAHGHRMVIPMDRVRVQHMLQDIETYCREAQEAARNVTQDTWDRWEKGGLAGLMDERSRLSAVSPEYRQVSAALVILHPYMDAWKITAPYRGDILDSPADERLRLLETVLSSFSRCTRISVADMRKHAYAFWPDADGHV